MSIARTARRRRKQMTMNNAHLSGRGVPRYRTPSTERKLSTGSGLAKRKK
jgi:hypothetical protein